MGEFGNGVVVAIKALQDDFDLVDNFDLVDVFYSI
jgi:hypothetical protein